MKCNYLPLGQTCSPATALRNLSLRKYAFPFDWIISSPAQICDAIITNFNGFHESLKLSDDKQYVVDSHGFLFPHDYPTIQQPNIYINESDEIGGIQQHIIADGWESHIPIIQEKYKRRVARFHEIMKSPEPVIALYAGEISAIQGFKEAFLKIYGKSNIWYAVLSEEIIQDDENARLLREENISLCDPEEILVDENDNMFIDKVAQANLWMDAILKIHLKI